MEVPHLQRLQFMVTHLEVKNGVMLLLKATPYLHATVAVNAAAL
jgi:hypothetical protein